MRSRCSASSSVAEILRARRLRTISVAERKGSPTSRTSVVRECALMLLIKGGTLFDGTGAAARPADVLVEDDRIAEIAPRGAFDGRAVEETIDAKGMTVLPGLIDAHIHIGIDPDHDGRLYLSAGVTSARDTG